MIEERIGIIGIGHIARDVVRGLIASGVAPERLLLSPRGRHVDGLVAEHGFVRAADNAEVVREADIVLLAVRPLQALACAEGLPWREGQLLISFCAGITHPALAQVTAPAEIVRAMPLGAAAYGRSPTIMLPENPRARALLERIGQVFAFADDEAFATATIGGVLYAAAHRFVGESADWLAARGIAPDLARALCAANLEAAATVIARDTDTSLDHLIAGIATPGGISEASFRVLDARGLPGALAASYDAGYARMKETGA